jgi:hypothetical protein
MNTKPNCGNFKAGQSGNPGGKPKNVRNRLQTKFLEALADDFDKHGVKAIKDARDKDPVGYIKAIVALMPKQFEQVSPVEELSDADLAAAVDVLRAYVAENPGAGTGTTH